MINALRLERGDEGDLSFIMAAERGQGYETLVGRWERDRHLAALTDGRHAYFVAREGGTPVGFVLLRGWASPERAACVKRVAVTETGRGLGRRILALAADAAFEETDAFRLWLGVFPENGRPRRAYEAAGFLAEGVVRGSAFLGGVHRDELLMSLLRPDWLRHRECA